MAVTLSSGDVTHLRTASAVFASPLAFDSTAAWRAASLDSIESLTGVDRSGFVLPLPGEPLISCGPALVPAAQAWVQYYYQLDVGYTRRRHERRLEAFHLLDLYDLDELVGSELYHDWHQQYATEDALAMAVEFDAGLPAASIQLYNRRPDPDFRERGGALLALMLPAFRTGIHGLVRFRQARAHLFDYFDREPCAVLVQALDGRVLHRTPALCRLLAADADHACLDAAMQAAGKAMASLLCRCAKSAEMDLPRPPEQRLHTAIGSYMLRASLLGDVLGASDPMVVVSLEPARERQLTAEEMNDRYGLTRREVEVARHVAAGETDATIATTLCVSRHTLRRHLERIYAKLGVHARAEVGPKLRVR